MVAPFTKRIEQQQYKYQPVKAILVQGLRELFALLKCVGNFAPE
jgi:hypothetical protein